MWEGWGEEVALSSDVWDPRDEEAAEVVAVYWELSLELSMVVEVLLLLLLSYCSPSILEAMVV